MVLLSDATDTAPLRVAKGVMAHETIVTRAMTHWHHSLFGPWNNCDEGHESSKALFLGTLNHLE